MYQPPNDLSGTAAIVSGASRGIGRIYALALAKAGAKVLATARTLEGDPQVIGSLAELEATGKAQGLAITIERVDLANPAEIEAAVDKCVGLFGRIDAIVNNATWTIKRPKPLEIDEAEWDSSFRINVKAPYWFLRAAAPHMEKAGGGSVVNISSLAARPSKPGAGAHGFPTYAVTKAALERQSTYFGADLAERGIAVNAISPGNPEYYMRDGRQPDINFWGSPIVHLAAQRPPEAITGKVLHTYEYGHKWGPEYASPPQWDDRLVEMLEISDKPFGYFAQR